MSLQARRFATSHSDFIHDVRYDYYGKRLATCSSDQSVRVWDLDDAGEWHVKEGGDWKNAHQGMIYRLCWAHPEFGQLIATCSADKTVKIWEEHEALPSEESQGQARWYPKAQLADSRKPVYDMDFAPRHLGLKIAVASADGCVRIYEALDVMNLTHWPLLEVFEPDNSGSAAVTCLSWNKSRFEQPMLVLGTDTGRAWVWKFDVNARQWQALCELERHNRMVCDIDWAPNVGRSYHLIASAGRDNKLKVHRLKRTEGSIEPTRDTTLLSADSEMWRAEWNVTGTVLACSGSDADVRVYKQNFKGEWVMTAKVSGDLGAPELRK